MSDRSKFDIYDRSFGFAVRAVNFLEKLPKTTAVMEYSRQLIKSSGSIGANLVEADGALTKKDFINKVGISRREAKESRHWLKLLKAIARLKNQSDEKELDWLVKKSNELLLILSSIIKNTQRKNS